jgi:hypothetical protein
MDLTRANPLVDAGIAGIDVGWAGDFRLG